MGSDLDGFSDEYGPNYFADESNGNSGDNHFDYSIDEVITQERIVSPSPAPKLLDLTNKSSSHSMLNLDETGAPLLPDNTILDPQRSEGAATPSKTTTTPLKPIIEEPVSCPFQSSSSPRLVERSVGSKSLFGLNCTSTNAIVSEIAAEGLSVPINPQPLETQPLPCLSQINTPENATGEITLPSTDLQGALSSLQPQCWLSSTAIELILSLCPSKSFRVFDPLAYDIGQPKTRSFKPTPNNVQYALLPLYHREHWTLALFDLENHAITYYDSLPRENVTAYRDALLKFANNFKTETFQWTFQYGNQAKQENFQYGNQAKQENFYDCGIFVLITSLHIFAGSICPPLYDCSLWRALFRALLTAKCGTELLAMKWKLSSSTSVEDENDGMWFLVFCIPRADNLPRSRFDQDHLSKPQAATGRGQERRGSC